MITTISNPTTPRWLRRTGKLVLALLAVSTLACNQLDAMYRKADLDLQQEVQKKRKFFGQFRDRIESSGTSSDSSDESTGEIIIEINELFNGQMAHNQDILELTLFFERIALEDPKSLAPLVTPSVVATKNWLTRQWNRILR